MRIAFLIALLAVAAAPAMAQEIATIQVDAAPVYSEPPHGPLNALVGASQGALQKGKEVRILDRKAYGGLKGDLVWYRVVVLDGSHPGGWVDSRYVR